MKSRKVAEINGRNIILVDQEYQKWDSGVYFDSLTDAVNYATGKFLKQ